MVCLNNNISFDKKILRNKLDDEINYLIKLDLELDLDKVIIDRITNKVSNRIKELFESDYFIDITMNRNICSYKYKKGKKCGYFCCKKITSNGDKNNYVCTQHNKNHIPKKKIKNKICTKTSPFPEKNNYDKCLSMIYNKHKIIKNKVKKNKKRKYLKIFLGNTGVINFSRLFSNIL